MISGNSKSWQLLNNYTLVSYFSITFIISWLCWLGLKDSTESSGFILDRFWLIAQIGVFAPSITAVFFSYLSGKIISFRKFIGLVSVLLFIIVIGIIVSEYKLSDLAQLPQWMKIIIFFTAVFVFSFFLFQKRILYTEQSTSSSRLRLFGFFISAWFLYPMIFLFVWILFHISVGDSSITMFEKSGSMVLPIFSLTIAFDFLFGGSVGEEIGWRGFALPILLMRYKPATASIVLGIIWSFWHIPIDMTAGFGVQGIGGILIRLLTVCPMSVIVTWFYLHSKYGIITSLLLHSGINIIPALGFSNYEIIFSFVIVIQLIIAVVIIIGDKTFREMKIQQEINLR